MSEGTFNVLVVLTVMAALVLLAWLIL